MRFASLGSGSEGNGLVVEAGTTRVLVDCGFGVREAAARLARLGLAPADISAIFVTHEHSDHVGGVAAFATRHDIPVWLTFGTLDAVCERLADVPRVYSFDSHDVLAIGELEVRPFPVPHEATALLASASSPTSASSPRTSRRASPPATRWCSSATTTRRCSPAGAIRTR